MTGRSMPLFWDRLIALLLGLSILPSLTALVDAPWAKSSYLLSLTGPPNFLKIGAPLVFLYFWWFRDRFSLKELRILGWTLLIGSIATLVSGAIPCRFPLLDRNVPNFILPHLREWLVMILGSLAALCFSLLTLGSKRIVLGTWAVVIYGSCLIDKLAPGLLAWLFNHVFDPATRAIDVYELSVPVLTGIFGRQSLAKILAWTPWLILAFWNAPTAVRASRARLLWGALFIGGSCLLILATGQRGPLLGACMGWVIFVAHQWFRVKDKTPMVASAVLLPVAVGLALIFLPKTLIESRFNGLIHALKAKPPQMDTLLPGLGPNYIPEIPPADSPYYTQVAADNVNLRKKMFLFSLDVVSKNPLGRSCIPPFEFRRLGMAGNHSHNMVLEQYRSRGWIWGSWHLGLWILAFIGAWRLRNTYGSAVVAGIATCLAVGMFDHPWFVLNHAVPLAILLFAGIRAGIESGFWRERKSVSS